MLVLLSLKKAFANSAVGVELPADKAFEILTNVLCQCGLGTKVDFTPRRAASRAFVRSTAFTIVLCVAATAVSAGAITLPAAPHFIGTWVDAEGYKYETNFSAECAKFPKIETVYAVTPSGKTINSVLNENGNYEFTANENGVYTVIADAFNGRSAELLISISNVDNTIPAIVGYEALGGALTVELADDLSGIDYGSIYAVLPNGKVMYPSSCDSSSSTIIFEDDEMNFTFFVSDIAGNVSRNTVCTSAPKQ